MKAPDVFPFLQSNPSAWVEAIKQWCEPDDIHWCDGSEAENTALLKRAVREGVLQELSPSKRPGCYLHRSHPNDTARVEHLTFICTSTRSEAGPTNNWREPDETYRELRDRCRRGMKGRTLYVIPYLMGIPGSDLCRAGIELTDSIYVALSMRLMTQVGTDAWQVIQKSKDFNRGLHCMLRLNQHERCIAHFPNDNCIISVSSNYGGNVLLGKKCLALRLASHAARREGWMAEHMLIICIESPSGEKTFIAAAFPSSCGKTNLAMLVPPKVFAGWKIWTVGDDIAWLRPGSDGRLYALNPEAGYFGVVPGTSFDTNPNAMEIMSRDTIFTNVAMTPDGDVWWEGKSDPPLECTDWTGATWTPASKTKAAHPNSRFASRMRNNPVLASEASLPNGVPISAIIFGGRRSDTVPLIYEARDWQHGVYLGAMLSSETTAAATGTVGKVRRDPMAMLPFCGYHLGDYLRHWLDMEKKVSKPPRIFHVNWFRKDQSGEFLWPGFGENMRVLKWIVDRCAETVPANSTAIGLMPRNTDIDLSGMENFSDERFRQCQGIHPEEWLLELAAQEEAFQLLGPDTPEELRHIHHQSTESVQRLQTTVCK